MRFVKPLDVELLRELALTHSCFLTVEENVVAGGAGSGVAEALQEFKRRPRIRHLGLPDRFINHGKPAEQLELAGLTPAAIAATARTLVSADRLHVG